MASVAKVALGRLFFGRPYTTDRPGDLRFRQSFRARAKTFLAWPGPATACHQWQPEAAILAEHNKKEKSQSASS